MSKGTLQSSAQPTTTVKVPHDKVAMRAYEKWCQCGRQHGTDVKNWIEAERELQSEMARTGGAKGR